MLSSLLTLALLINLFSKDNNPISRILKCRSSRVLERELCSCLRGYIDFQCYRHQCAAMRIVTVHSEKFTECCHTAHSCLCLEMQEGIAQRERLPLGEKLLFLLVWTVDWSQARTYGR